MSHSSLLKRQSFTCTLVGNSTPVSVDIMTSFAATVNFSFLGHPYMFSVTKWSRRGQAQFYSIFHEVQRDEDLFGTLEADGTVKKTTEQKLNCIVQAIKDVMFCLNIITETHQRSVLDYAVYFREKVPDDDTYGHYITLITCHCIVHQHFIYPSAQFTVVKFYPSK